jgi:hypothetical protein
MNISEQIKFLVSQNLSLLNEAQNSYNGVYIARVEEDDGINLEVEVSEGTIALSIRLEEEDLATDDEESSEPVDKVYNELKDHLESNDISVYDNAEDWEEALTKEED